MADGGRRTEDGSPPAAFRTHERGFLPSRPWAFHGLLAACGALLVLGCEEKPAAPSNGGGGSAPLREATATSRPPGENLAPVVDPTGAVQSYTTMKHDIACLNNLEQNKLCLIMYEANTGAYPDPGKFWKVMVESGTIADWHICVVPRGTATREDVIEQRGDQVYRTTKDRLTGATAPDKPIVWDPVPYKDGRHVLTFSGRIELMTEEEFQKRINAVEGVGK
jgi:hypothetical protein